MATHSIPPSVTKVPSGFLASGGNIAFDEQYFYVNYNGWRRFPLIQTCNLGFSFPAPSNNGDIYCDNEYFYIIVNSEWLRLPIFVIKPHLPIRGKVPTINIQNTKLSTFPSNTDTYGCWGMIAFNAEYFCIWGQGKWHKVPIVPMPSSISPAIPLDSMFSEFIYVTKPLSVYTEPGFNVSFSVSASSLYQPLEFQWYLGKFASNYIPLSDGGHITGSRSPVLYINTASIQNSGSYLVEISHPKGFSCTSSAANLIILPPVILSQPTSQTNYKTDFDIFFELSDQNFFTASFNIMAYGGLLPLTYQWYSGSTPLIDSGHITGSYLINGNTSSLQINSLEFNEDGTYWVSVSNGVTTTSSVAPLTVLDNVIPTFQSESIYQNASILYGNSQDTGIPYKDDTAPIFGVSFLTGSLTNTVISTQNCNDTASTSIGFENGYIVNVITPIYGGYETSSYNIGFENGYIFDVVIPITASTTLVGFPETSSYNIGFENGYTTTVVNPIYSTENNDTTTTFGVSLLMGSVL